MEQPEHLKVYHPGDSFGELALLYNAPRAATIISKTNSVLFSLDRDTFNNIVKVYFFFKDLCLKQKRAK